MELAMEYVTGKVIVCGRLGIVSMKATAIVVTMLAGLMAGNLRADPIIQYQVTDLGGTSYRYDYALSGFNLLANDEIVIEFDPALYGTLSNGVAPAGFDLMLFQRNQPPGASGECKIGRESCR